MERLDLGDVEILPVTIFGKDFDLTMPTMNDIVDMQSAIEQAKDDKTRASFDAVKVLITKMGMPDEVSNKMQLNHFEKLVEHVMKSKKK